MSGEQACPIFVELEEHASGETHGPRASWISAHASSCAECANALSEIRADRELESRLQRAFSPDEVRAPRALPAIDGYLIQGELGRGGMGVVYEALQLVPPRRVALKVVRGAQYVDATTLRLFQREIRVLARLEHPGIAALYDAGSTSSGEHYFAMELVRGTSLVERAKTLDRAQYLELFLQLCAAIDFAHQHGVVHRDLKPSNVLVTSEGRVKVLDFGLAKITDHDVAQSSLLTEAGQIRGTLAYMSPEQARGDPSTIDLRSDVYSLGVVLYQLCTKKLPTDVFNVQIHEAARRICEDAPKRPSSIDATVRGDLETIVLKALEKDATRRYASAAALAEDVRRFLADEVILARPPSTTYELKKLVARHKVAFALATTIFVLSIGTAVWTGILYERESELRIDADKKSVAADEARAAEVKAKLAAQAAETVAQEQAHLAEEQATLAGQQTKIAQEETKRAEKEALRAQREAKTYERVKDFMLEIFTAADPELKDQGSVTARELLGRAAEQLELLTDEPEIRSALSLALGSVYTDMELYREAGPLLEKALELRRATPDVAPMLLAETLSELGRLRTLTHEHPRALELGQEALAIYQREEPQGGLMWAMGLARLGQLAKDMGEYVHAEDLLRQAVAMRERCGDRTSESSIGAKSSLAVVLRQLRRDDEAEEMMSQIVENRRAQDVKSIRLAVALSNLGLAKLSHGDPQGGEALVREAFEMKKDLLGEENPTMASAHSNLAYACDFAGKRDESLQHYLRAIEMCERDPELNRYLLGIIYKNLARLHRNCGRLAEAEEACMVSIEIREAQVPRDETSLADSYDNMGAISYSKQEYKTAEEWMRKALVIYEREIGKQNMRTAMVLENVGGCQLAQGNDAEAEKTLLEAFVVLESLQTANPGPMRSTADFLARLYERQGKTEEAAKYRAISTSKP